jgi:hypothetical protein
MGEAVKRNVEDIVIDCVTAVPVSSVCVFVQARVSVKIQLQCDHLVSVYLKLNVLHKAHNLVVRKCVLVHGCL